jgi:hypothetical protein
MLMADQFCLMPDAIADFKKALKDKSLDMAAFFDARTTTAEREAMMRPYAGDNALGVVRKLEQTRVMKNRELGVENAISKLGKIGKWSPEQQAAIAKAKADFKAQQAERIFSPQEHETFLNSLANKLTGTEISPEVAQRIFELTSEMQKLKDVDAKMSGVSDAYLQAKNALNAYMRVQKNLAASPAKNIIGNLAVVSRDVKLMNLATPIKVTISQAENTLLDRIGLRLPAGVDSDLAKKANAEAWQTYVKTGVNTASTESLADIGLNKLGERLNFRDIPQSTRPGITGTMERATGAVAKIADKIAIDWEHNIGFTKFYHKVFFDVANRFATKAAKEFGGDANEIFKDAVRIEPETQAGAAVRIAAQKGAARVTNINDTWASALTMKLKSAVNDMLPGYRLGDFLIPMAKIPSNVIANAIENAGPGIPLGIRDIILGKRAIASTDPATHLQGLVQTAQGYQKLTRTLGVIGAAALFASALDKKDFRSDKFGHHQVHIAGHWIDTEYLAFMSPALAGMAEARIHGNPLNYITGAGKSLAALPGIDEIPKIVEAVSNSDLSKGLIKWGKDFVKSAVVPGIVSNALNTRPANRILFGAHGFESDAQVRQDELEAARKRALSRAGVSQ